MTDDFPRRTFRLYEDVLPAGAPPVFLPSADRALYPVSGGVTAEYADGAQSVPAGTGWTGGGELTLLPGEADARVWRWELLPEGRAADGTLRAAPRTSSRLLLEHEVALDPGFGWLMRCDRVSFPPGGTAWTHVHQGPGIRVCLDGEITIETEGRTTVSGPGEAWFELGPAPVLAPTTDRTATTFVRCFLLPRALLGRSSLRYVLPEDTDKPKTQRYHVFSERVLDLG
ncbi:hypothetical protein BJF79_20470 [Actinomadura sp. CNU-125]|uniref:cupin domain-containing protein n=1 Tax=Actinomadura sp. CNU-125 TaxID=1904961 RepID=UPI000968F6FF|nr:cupin domain-containing protein [Actinomadura sp. CNU-125]OLT13537.1 hypothetical protein BJF79_20470 [Actinomadura sp. CNU-125]